ncbi:MAG TPA: hypothetical protein VMW35_18390 [Myxococcota bacterium]|nr:hypothetical protein [Myxococcota bacterium]
MQRASSQMVDIVRDFLAADRLMRDLLARYEQGRLRFEEVEALVGDDERSVLFRLKEQCHALFRGAPPPGQGSLVRREALFDLAVGSLFHEAMKLRENLYQELVYRPKVQALQRSEGAGDPIFAEFQKILDTASKRLAEARPEVEALLAHTRAQFKTLIAAHRENGFVTRYLIANADLVEDVFAGGIDALLGEIHGSPTAGYERAVMSYLASGYFPEALRVLEGARARGFESAAFPRLAAYADGMQRYIEGRYPEAVERLEAWLGASPTADETGFARLALAAVQRIGEVGGSGGAERVAAAKLAARIAGVLEAASDDASGL